MRSSMQRTAVVRLGRSFYGVFRRGLASSPMSTNHHDENIMRRLRHEYRSEMEELPEYRAQVNLINFLESKAGGHDHESSSHITIKAPNPPPDGYKHSMTSDQVRLTLDAAMATFALHVESRIAALVGQGFYTIGPCGEELMASMAHALHPTDDTMALHYRHLGVNLASQLLRGTSLDHILLDRARGYTASRYDPVTGGVHCVIGSGGGDSCDYVATSTLASQCPAAVGRALGFALRQPQFKKKRSVSLVTVGDGSVHNHHFLAAYHLARHARYKQFKCPVVFGITDNGLSISYKTGGYLETMFHPGIDDLVPVFYAHGGDMMDIYSQSVQAIEYAREKAAPAVVVYRNIVRRFGHAATDRQHAYLETESIERMAHTDVLAGAIVQAVDTLSAGTTYAQVRDRFSQIVDLTRSSFDQAAAEEKVTRHDMLERVSQPMVQIAELPREILCKEEIPLTKGSRDVMRKHMTRVIREILADYAEVVYIGEDVEHGGYYLVTDGLAKQFPGRVLDFPPDETTLLGTAMGFSQVGLVPIVEIPYAKYLDCGVDMYNEIAIMNWLTNGQRPNGMVIRLQGFGRGIFGGNFHTHNILSHIPPGVDMVCYSNGEDYVRGFRNAVLQAKNGRVVVLVDCTHLLNLRHLHGKDRGWERSYPENQGGNSTDTMSFHDVCRYGVHGRWAIVSYGNGVVSSLQARKALSEKGVLQDVKDLDVIDCPYISSIPNGLRAVVREYEGILFADICKEGPGNVLSFMVSELHGEGVLPNDWEFVGAPRTYNPLGSHVTFLSSEDIELSFMKLLKQSTIQRSTFASKALIGLESSADKIVT